MTQLNRAAYQQLVDENLAWLNAQPRTLERDHIADIVAHSVDVYYPPEGSYVNGILMDSCGKIVEVTCEGGHPAHWKYGDPVVIAQPRREPARC